MSNLSAMFVFDDGPATGQSTIHAHNFLECIVHFDLFCWYRSPWWELFKHILQGCLILVGTSKVTQKHMGKINCVLTHLPRTKWPPLWQTAFSNAFLAATKQLYEWCFLSVCPSVCLSVTPFWLCSHHRIIIKFSGVITTDQGNVHAKGQGQRSKVKFTEVTTQLDRFRTVTPVWIHIWWWNDAYSLMLLRRGALLFFKVIRQISRSHGSKNRRIWLRLGVSGL